MAALTLGALGVVYGDIGTSPLYALKECISPEHGIDPTRGNVLGVLSLIFWALTLVVTVKYLVFIVRANNEGEGGILALLALVPEGLRTRGAGKVGLVAVLGIIGAALLYGDGMITPAISVLSAIEGLDIVAPGLERSHIVIITVMILIGLFWIQRQGTAKIGVLFGPIMTVWFLSIGILGGAQIVQHPGVLEAISPHHAVRFFIEHGGQAFLLLGSVVLVVTGGEALYADMGHFGVRPIRLSWLTLVKPALLLAYFGQGANLIQHQGDEVLRSNPFFGLVSGSGPTLYLVVLGTMATVIASQALISGVYSLTQTAVQLGYLPRFQIKHTSHSAAGQIYVPGINFTLAVACIALVVVFEESTKLAAAYGIAVAGTMAITSIIFYVVMRESWKWPVKKALPLFLLFIVIDAAFLGGNIPKIIHGGWVPLVIASVIVLLMLTWQRGRGLYAEYVAHEAQSWAEFLGKLQRDNTMRVPGTAVFLASALDAVPSTMLRHEQMISVMHRTVLVVHLEMHRVPWHRGRRHTVRALGDGFYIAEGHYGFMEKANVAELTATVLQEIGNTTPLDELTYYLGRETFLVTNLGKMRGLSEKVFGWMQNNALSAAEYFQLPPEQVVELGRQIDL